MRICLLFIWLCLIPLSVGAQEVYDVGIACPESGECVMKSFEPFLSELYRRAGARAEFKVLPRMRELQAVDSGELDATALCSPVVRLSYPQISLIPTPLARVALRAYTLDPNVEIRTPEDLAQHSVTAVRGEVFAMSVLEQVGIRGVLASSYVNMFKMLQRGRVEVVLISEIAGRLTIGKMGLTGVVESPVLTTGTVHHGINKRLEGVLATRLDEALREMLEDGSARELLPGFFR